MQFELSRLGRARAKEKNQNENYCYSLGVRAVVFVDHRVL